MLDERTGRRLSIRPRHSHHLQTTRRKPVPPRRQKRYTPFVCVIYLRSSQIGFHFIDKLFHASRIKK